MALCFVANKDLTVPFSDISRPLSERGEEVVWLSPSRRWTEWLVREGWPRQDILSIPDFAAEWRALPFEEARAGLVDVEDAAPQTASNIVQMCRYLRREKPSFAYPYLAVVRRRVEDFLRERKVEVAFGEGTWGFELVSWLVCQRLGIPMVLPATTRIPSGRFYMGDAVSSDLWSFTEATPTDVAWAEEFLDKWLTRPIQPDYMAQHTHGYKALYWRWVPEFLRVTLQPELDSDDATLWPLPSRIADRLRRASNAYVFRYARPYERELPKDERYVLYPLHHQPEASVDVLGSLNSNQTALIESLSRLLPATHLLWVKEHKGALGDRSLAWYRHIARLPNVRLVDPFKDIFPLIRNADLVVTISGTAGYEAALMGVPAVGLAPVFFWPLLENQPSHRAHPLDWQMGELLSRQRAEANRARARRRAVAFLAHLRANSFLGDPIDLAAPAGRRAAPGYMAQEREGFVAFISGLRRNGGRLAERKLPD
jgi:hypothetical protein